MERAKLKFTVIILLVILNVILLGIVINQRGQAKDYEQVGRTQALVYLEQHGISVAEDVIPWESHGKESRLDPDREAFLAEQTTEVTEYDEGLVRQLIDKITVYDDHLAFEFKSGLETEVQM